MGNFGSFYKGDKRKIKKLMLEKKAREISSKQGFVLPKIEIIKKGKEKS